MTWVLTGFGDGADEPAFERELLTLTTDAVREIVGETGVHPWDGAWPVEGALLKLVRRHAPKELGVAEHECFLEWRER